MDDTRAPLDLIDRDILARLQVQARITNTQLAQDIGLSPASTLERVRKLERSGLIKSYRARLAPEKLGLHMHLMVQVKLQSSTTSHVSKFKQVVAQLPEVVTCYQLVGNADFLIEIYVPDLAAYQELVMHKLSAIEGVQHVTPSIVTDTLKEAGLSVAST